MKIVSFVGLDLLADFAVAADPVCVSYPVDDYVDGLQAFF